MAKMPHLVEVQEELGSESFSLVGVTDAGLEEVEEFAREFELNFPILCDAEAVGEAYGVDLIWGSVFYLVDPERRIVADALVDALRIVRERVDA